MRTRTITVDKDTYVHQVTFNKDCRTAWLTLVKNNVILYEYLIPASLFWEEDPLNDKEPKCI